MKNLNKKRKALLLTNIISPYRLPLFTVISEKVNIHFKVVALAEREKNREWELSENKIKFEYQILHGWHWFIWGEKREVAIHLNRGVFKAFLEYKPDVIITSGYDDLAYWQAYLYCKLYRKKFILWNGTTLLSAGNTRGIRGLLKRIIVRGADRCIAYGIKAKEYLEYLGAKAENIHINTNTVDMEYFESKVIEYRNKDSFLRERKLYPKYLLLYIGQLIKRKGILQVLRALECIKDSEIGLFVVGSGPEESKLRDFCKEKKLKNIFFEGFKQQEELIKYYAFSDIFILPSFEEVWGLVINEALASGLYVLSSKYAGVSYDLIKVGWNGEIFDVNNVEEIVNLIKKVKENIKNIRKRRDDISKNACKEFSIEISAGEFIKAIKEV
jgi:glycosyltransferase involved in cell wall biosynthesis